MDTPIACPQYMFCVEGSIVPEACIDGQLCDTAVAGSQEVYTDCTNGYYCIKGYRQVCYAGYQCNAGSTTPIPTDANSGIICPKGYFCEG